MTNTFVTEIWKEVQFDFEYVNKLKVEVSNFGRVRSFSKLTNGKILGGSLVNGYRIVRFKFFKEHDSQTAEKLKVSRQQIAELMGEIRNLQLTLKNQEAKDTTYRNLLKQIATDTKALNKIRAAYQKEYRATELKRTINHGALVHRMVAACFLERPSPEHCVVGHLDYYRLDNQVSNLKWMTKEENRAHQGVSPHVIEARKNRINFRNSDSKVYKLTTASVMLIKKKIEQGVSLRIIAKSFKVSETQLLRIKGGQNWGNITAAQ